MTIREQQLLELWTRDAQIYAGRMGDFYRLDDLRSRCVDDNEIGIPRGKQKSIPRVCMQCGRDFKARTKGKKYCGLMCLRMAEQQKERQREREERIRLGLPVRALRVRGYWQTIETSDGFK
jgi:hypothetical protein